jgi:phenylacetate-CoA ligase
MNNLLKRLARILPDDILFGESFRYAKKINSAFKESKDKMDFVSSYQNEKLKSIFKIAGKTPFYQYLNEAPVQLEKLPFISKEIVLKSFDRMIVSKSGADYITTGGTSGKPLGFYINKNRKGFEWFWMTNNWGKAGFSMMDYRAVLRNHKLNGKESKVDSLLREIQYNNFSLTKEYLDIILADINNRNIRFLHAYPSAAFILANTIKKLKSKTSLKTFLCGSENIFPFQKQLIQDELNIRMYTWYGHSEKLILAGENGACENYHSIPFYGYSEIIDENNKRIEKKGLTGELVGTGFMNTKMPFIRYQTGDFAEYVGESCPDCGHIGLTFKKVQGRWKGDRIYKSDNTIITTTALNLHNNVYNFIQNIQYVQEEKGILEVRVIPEKNYTSSIREKILSEISMKVGGNLQINLVEVDSVEYSAINKFQLLIQKVKEDPEIGFS